jgi:N-methylhydantoinase B
MRDRDAFGREIVQSALTAIAEEAALVSSRSAYSAFNTEMPIGAGLFDATGQLIAQTESHTMHMEAVRCMLRGALKKHPPSTLKPGDVLITNDPFQGGIHPTDVTVVMPIYNGEELVAFYGGMMIVTDLGGVTSLGLPANATECFHEGLIIPPLKLMRGGELNPEVIDLIQANSRAPKAVLGDVLALVAGANWAAKELLALMTKHGRPTLEAIIEELLDYAERVLRTALSRVPDGTYSGSFLTEDDGVEPGRHLIAVNITIANDQCTMDFTGTGPSARGPINASYSQALSLAMYMVRCLAREYLPDPIPLNEGVYRPVTVVLPPGTMVNAQFPSATNARLATTVAMADSICEALAPVCPSLAMAPPAVIATANAGGLGNAMNEYWCMLDPHFGATGGRATMDGIDGMTLLMTPGPAYPRSIEYYESLFPVRFWSSGIRPDSGGPGRWRGGAGTIKECEFLSEADLTLRAMDRHVIPPPGTAGGRPGRRGHWILNKGRPDERELPAKLTNVRVHPGDVLWRASSGAGGYGDPLSRPCELVADDVERGAVTIEGALTDYGVVIDSASGSVDADATASVRSQRARVSGATVTEVTA